MSDLNEKGIEAAWEAIAPFASGRNKDAIVHAAIRAYLSAAVPADVAGLVDRLENYGNAFAEPLADEAATALAVMAAENAFQKAANRTLASENELNKRMFHDASRSCEAAEAENERLTRERADLGERGDHWRVECGDWQARAESAEAENARLRDAIAEKDAALEPFAEAATGYEGESGAMYASGAGFRVSHIRAARRAHGGQAGEPDECALKGAIQAYERRCRSDGGYMPAIATMLRVYADEMADKYPDDTNGGLDGRAALEEQG